MSARFHATVALLAVAIALFTCGSARAASAYVITDSTTGVVLAEFGSDKKLQIASLTKVATAMVVLDWAAATKADLNQLAVVPQSAAGLNSQPGAGLQPGDSASLRDLLYAALLQSDNIAAATLAEHVGSGLSGDRNVPPMTRFVQQMNALAKSKGMLKTRFLNSHGLDHLERNAPYSTAADLAKLAAYAMANSAFRFYVSQTERKITFTTAAGEANSYLLRNTNELLGQNGIDGIKTGTTTKAGQCLILSAAKAPESIQKGETHFITPRRLNVVLLGSTDRFREGAGLLARGWQVYDSWTAAGRPTQGWQPQR